MGDEEKKAIEYWKGYMKILHWNTQLASEHYIKVLLDLVEKQSKEIEDNKKYIDLHYVPYEQYISKLNELNKKWEDKIKTKIEEWQKEKEFYNKDEDREWGQYNNWDWIDSFINELQSLLRKEFPVTITKEELEKRWKE